MPSPSPALTTIASRLESGLVAMTRAIQNGWLAYGVRGNWGLIPGVHGQWRGSGDDSLGQPWIFTSECLVSQHFELVFLSQLGPVALLSSALNYFVYLPTSCM